MNQNRPAGNVDDKDLICHTGVPGSVQRRSQDGVQAQLLPGQGSGNGGAPAHPLQGWKHKDRCCFLPTTALVEIFLLYFLLLTNLLFLTHFLFVVLLHFLFLIRFPSVTGVALKHTYEKAFSVENGMRRNVPKVVVAITDGRSQDEVKKNAAKLQQAGNRDSRKRKLWPDECPLSPSKPPGCLITSCLCVFRLQCLHYRCL